MEAKFDGLIIWGSDRYQMDLEIGPDGFELRYADEFTTLGQQLARAVVVNPRHRCTWNHENDNSRTAIPSKSDRLTWIRKTFDITYKIIRRRDRQRSTANALEVDGYDDDNEWEDCVDEWGTDSDDESLGSEATD